MNIIFNTLNGLLQNMYAFTGDFGIAIICMTLIVKLLLSPFSLKQKKSMMNSQKLLKEHEVLKKKNKHNKAALEKLDMEFAKKNAQSMAGCLVSMIQLPIIFSLYSVVLHMPMQASTAIIPWVSDLKATDSYFIIPIIYILCQSAPMLLSYIKSLNEFNQPMSKGNIFISSIVSLLIVIKAPIALGIYFITSSIFAFLEDLFFRIYYKKACANI